MRVAFISDLHLSAQDKATDRAFHRFMQGQALELDQLYVLGDLFDYWLGDAQLDWDPYAQQVCASFQELARSGVTIAFMHGNRDFMLGARFAQACGAELLPTQHMIELGGERVLMLHGDELCTADTRYQRLRRILRSRAFFHLANRLPPKWRQALAHKLREGSDQYKARTAMHIMDAEPEAIRAVMQRHGVATLIHGHTHRPGTFPVPGAGKRHVLPDWQHPAPLLGWNPQQGFHPIEFPNL